MKQDVEASPLRPEGRWSLIGIAVLAAALIAASIMHKDLGAPACAVGLLSAVAIGLRDRRSWKQLLTGVSWSVLPLVAGLFVIVEAMNRGGALHAGVQALTAAKSLPPVAARLTSSAGVAVLSNAMNNLPAGLIAAACVKLANVGSTLRNAVLVGIDLGPNLSITGSLATILWLIAIRREGLNFTFFDFLKSGLAVMPPALIAATLLLR